jgi:methylenetetrahydrofolate--tRNA-(uracil-5-)-methyltransferase
MTGTPSSQTVHIIGAGLAGSEAAWQIAERGVGVVLHEMRPTRMTEAHRTDGLAELVCSNSFRSDDAANNAVGLLHAEMRKLGSLIMRAADANQVPAGGALAVDREGFSAHVTKAIASHPRIEMSRGEVKGLPPADWANVIVATGPLTSATLADAVRELTDEDALAFFDAIAPIVHKDTIDMSVAWFQSRYDKAGPGGSGADYINCPMDREQYDRFYDALVAAEAAESKEWEKLDYFEGCLPIEVLATRGRDTLRFGPMKPMGLRDPRTGKTPWAVVQLRKENLRADSYNLVGFQNHLKWGEQAHVLRLIPGLENARFLRYGQIHRNTYICAPVLIDPLLRLKTAPHILFAGQISGVEGYTESIATGMLSGIYAAALTRGEEPAPVPRGTALGSLVHYITHADAKDFQPANITFDLLEPLEEELRRKIRDKKERHRIQCERALAQFDSWWATAKPEQVYPGATAPQSA